jgi:hypothetical protein
MYRPNKLLLKKVKKEWKNLNHNIKNNAKTIMKKKRTLERPWFPKQSSWFEDRLK